MSFSAQHAVLLLVTLLLPHPVATAGSGFARKTKAGKILRCTSSKVKAGRVCLITTYRGKKGSRINIYNKNKNWVATGYIYKRRKNRAIILVKNIKVSLRRGYLVKFNNSFLDSGDWSSAFSNAEI